MGREAQDLSEIAKVFACWAGHHWVTARTTGGDANHNHLTSSPAAATMDLDPHTAVEI